MALEGIRVLDLTMLQQGGGATLMLGDLGAEVLKVEPPGMGDQSRFWRSMLGVSLDLGHDRNVVFECLNRNKRSIVLDLKTDEGRRIARELAHRCDVLVHNFREGVVERLGLAYEDLVTAHPGLIYASASAYGTEGPDATKPGMDPMGAMRSGLLHHMTPPGRDFYYPLSIADQAGATMLAFGVMAALFARERHGCGQKVETSLLASLTWAQMLIVHSQLLAGARLPAGGRNTGDTPLINMYAAGDGEWLYLALADPDRFWHPFCEALDLLELEHDERFATYEARAAHFDEIVSIIDERFTARTRDEWLEYFAGEYPDFQVAPLRRIDELESDPQMTANGYIVEVTHPVLGQVKLLGPPVRMSATPGSIRSCAPEHGQHTDEVLADVLGYSADQIDELRRAEVI